MCGRNLGHSQSDKTVTTFQRVVEEGELMVAS